ncbi:MAG: hypothetical protein C5B58_01400 [Acidobacteria bacterium]|nr:MAG: hypothetical protein C5B58_01400 [Acidobacteriota bacterium]
MANYDELVPDPQARIELGHISAMTAWRWDRDPKMTALGWPPRAKIGKRNYRSRKEIERFKAAVQEDAKRRAAV